MHIHLPGLAARWDREYGGAVSADYNMNVGKPRKPKIRSVGTRDTDSYVVGGRKPNRKRRTNRTKPMRKPHADAPQAGPNTIYRYM